MMSGISVETAVGRPTGVLHNTETHCFNLSDKII